MVRLCDLVGPPVLLKYYKNKLSNDLQNIFVIFKTCSMKKVMIKSKNMTDFNIKRNLL